MFIQTLVQQVWLLGMPDLWPACYGFVSGSRKQYTVLRPRWTRTGASAARGHGSVLILIPLCEQVKEPEDLRHDVIMAETAGVSVLELELGIDMLGGLVTTVEAGPRV